MAEPKEMTEYEAMARFRVALNAHYGPVLVVGKSYTTATALEKLDASAYQTYFNDWIDSQNIELMD